MTTIRTHEILHAHKRMMLGASLAQAADAIGAEPQDLDLALWRYLGRHGWTENNGAKRSFVVRYA